MRPSDKALRQHRVGDLQEAGNVGAGLEVRVILLCSLSPREMHVSPHASHQSDHVHTKLAGNHTA